MTAALLAMISAAVFGIADFLGGFASRRARVMAVVGLSQFAGLLLVAGLLPVLPGAFGAEALVWGMTAGLAGAAGLVLFYWALANGTMSVVAPVTASTSAAVPVVFGLATGERPQPLALAGVAVALVAVVLVSRTAEAPKAGTTARPVVAAFVSGAAFGGFFILLSLAPDNAGMWPLVGARLASLTLIVTLALATHQTLKPGPGSLPFIVGAGVLDMAANVLYLLAVQSGGMISLVAVLSSLYPVGTLLLARYVLGERLGPVQLAGVGFALGAAVLIAAG
ncbi:DMT family transporter [Sinosporangium siamense]|uniref:Multidrug transporter n=1 Tax=Sinosporangium siamense TaxID=1367973 RepID=A0A919V580_9ACTN|nr:DMT family transporter [Sinosporangium siamense]GII92715.1 multidrug transporter [Sinosporangium siamense]